MNNYKYQGLVIVLFLLVFQFTLFTSCEKDDLIKQYSIVFHSNGGTQVDDLVVNSGARITKPQDPTKKDSILDNWFKDVKLTEPFAFGGVYYTTKGFDLYAKWTKKHEVSFETNGGTMIPSVIVKAGDFITKPLIPIKEGYQFGGWFTDANLITPFDFLISVNKDITVYVKWVEIIYYSVAFNSNGGGSVPALSIKSGEYVSEPEISNPGKTLVGWYIDELFTKPFVFLDNVINENTNIYAQWAVSSSESDFEFDTTTGTITKYLGNQLNIVIPKTIQGVTVKVLGFSLFIDSPATSVILPNTINEFQSKTDGNFETVSRTFSRSQIKYVNLFNTKIKTLPKWTFGWSSLNNITLPGTLEQIQQGAFESSALTSVKISNSVKYIDNYAFYGCNSLSKITFGKGLLNIDNGAFFANSNLSEVIVTREILPITTIGNIFSGVSSLFTIKIPNALVNTYKNSWQAVSDKIIGY